MRGKKKRRALRLAKKFDERVPVPRLGCFSFGTQECLIDLWSHDWLLIILHIKRRFASLLLTSRTRYTWECCWVFPINCVCTHLRFPFRSLRAHTMEGRTSKIDFNLTIVFGDSSLRCYNYNIFFFGDRYRGQFNFFASERALVFHVPPPSLLVRWLSVNEKLRNEKLGWR